MKKFVRCLREAYKVFRSKDSKIGVIMEVCSVPDKEAYMSCTN